MPHSEFSAYARARAKLTACMRALYEDTLMPVREIARLAGVSERAVQQMSRRHRWRLRCPEKGNHRRKPAAKERLRPPTRPRGTADSAAARRAAENMRLAVSRRRKVRRVAAELQANAETIYARRRTVAELRTLASIGRALRELVRLQAGARARGRIRRVSD